ncbi:MAG: glycosyltransferase family 9 protein [Desulfuromonadaceae bacterium]|nr:glycosyltransferase family 9 protein [Desulfuromonadaceae bacterium]
MILLFEPWNLGDAFIAASVARLAPERFILACNSRWHEVLTLASESSLNMLPLDLPYVWRTDKKFFSLGDAASTPSAFISDTNKISEVISIRGDIRDWVAAQRLFRDLPFNFTGWIPFCARKISLVDLPFKHGYLAVRNRYRAWAAAAGIPFSKLESAYALHPEKKENAPVLIHVGAQWRSKQYPNVAELAQLLSSTGNRVEILAGPSDPLPDRILAEMVQRPGWRELVEKLRTARYVVTNDSGPMHLAAYLGCRTLALSRCSNISEWLPPAVTALSSRSAPRGYRPKPEYWSDQVLPGWPSPSEVAAIIESEVQGTILTDNQIIKGFEKP